ncbi:Ent-kaurene oxidase [Aspergillus luchuensis]|uniref:Ent-kaurene oxidase n=1 Tax=Aspergillus kawachii TaxID=1069201 RepID=A0A146EYI3_ASPKA|nr:Ent-kaurene oxidase [Aspergillus luchuensis]
MKVNNRHSDPSKLQESARAAVKSERRMRIAEAFYNSTSRLFRTTG